MAGHVWEHLTLEDAGVAAKNCHSYLVDDQIIKLDKYRFLLLIQLKLTKLLETLITLFQLAYLFLLE